VTTESVRLQEQPKADFVRVIGHRVHWDSERALWYCDIELNPGANYMPFVRLALVRYQPNALHTAKISKVVLAEFAQVLPRRRLRVRENENGLSFALHGPSPQYGPTLYTRDSAFQDVSFENGPFDSGRNRVEIVLQAQDEGIDSELGWRDVKVLSDQVVGVPDLGPGIDPPDIVTPQPGITTGRTTTSLTTGGRRVVRRAGGSVLLPSVFERRRATATDYFRRDPAFWSADITIPQGTGNRRILVREFERFYSDNTVNQHVGNKTYLRRVIEERLVFADVVDFTNLG
jgi:hypothetical protein